LAWRWSAVAVVLIAAVLRFYALTWGLPNAIHAYSYHPDEFLPVGSAFNILSQGDLNPHFYNYPSLYIYICALAQGFASVMGFANDFGIYVACRIVTAVMGVLAVAVCLYGCGKLYGRKAGIAAGLFLAVLAVHAQHSHFATVDVPSTLFVAGCLIAAIFSFKTGSIKWLILSGILAGLAGGTKYNAGLVCLSAAAAPWLCASESSIVKRLGKSALVFLCAGIAFVISTPGCLLYTSEFLNGLTYELKHSAHGHGLVFAGTGPGVLFALHNLAWGMGLPLLIVGIISIIYATITKRKESIILLAFLIPYMILMSTSQVRFVRYAIPALPCFAIFTALAFAASQNISISYKRVLVILSGLIVAGSLIYCIAIVTLFAPPDTRDSSRDYIVANASKADSIGFIDLPWFYSPPLGKMLGYGTTDTRRKAISESTYPITILSEMYPNDLLPNWVVISDYEIDDALRLCGTAGLYPEDSTERDKILSVYDVVNQKYAEEKTFNRQVLWFDSSRLPHDMHYTAPRITLYRLKK
jgi:4-amino-4-deoxy-L-arabinose transferase-like glycosyltransferase